MAQFGPGRSLSRAELAFVELLRDRLAPLIIVAGPTPGEQCLGVLGENARALAPDLHRFGMAAFGQGVSGAATSAFALALRCRLQFATFQDREALTELRHWALARHADGEFEDALAGLQCVQRLLANVAKRDPESLDNRNDMGVVFLDRGDYTAALDVLRPLVATNRRVRPGRGRTPRR